MELLCVHAECLHERRAQGHSSRNAPSKECKKGKGRVERRICVRAGRVVKLSTAAETVQRIEQPGAHEADDAEHRDLCHAVCV